MLRLSVFGDAEVAGLQPGHNLSGFFIAYHHIRQHDVAVYLQGVRRLRVARILGGVIGLGSARGANKSSKHGQNQRMEQQAARS